MRKAAKNKQFSVTIERDHAILAQVVTLVARGNIERTLRALCAWFGYALGPRL